MSEERPPNKQQLDELFGALLPFAHQTLEKYGEFFPFGATMDREGSITFAAGHTGSEQPPSQDVIDLMVKAMRRDRAKYVAIGICYDVRIRPSPEALPSDAICVSLEHADGLTVDVFEPYEKQDVRFQYGVPFAQAGQLRVFGR